MENTIKVVIPISSFIYFKVALDSEFSSSEIETLSAIMFSDTIYAPFQTIDTEEEIEEIKEKLSWITWEQYPDWIYFKDSLMSKGLSYNSAYNLMEFAMQHNAFIFFMDWDEREEVFLKVLNSFSNLSMMQQYREILNKSALVQNILGFIIFNELSPNIRTISDTLLDNLSKIIPLFKRELQEAVLYYSGKFQGQYYLNQQNKEWLKEEIIRGQQKVLEQLSPEKLKKFDIRAPISDAISLLAPIPLSTITEIYRLIKSRNILKTPQMKLGWATLIMKKLIQDIKTINAPNNCIVCSMTPEEIQNLDDNEAENIIQKIMSDPEKFLCENHMISWLDIRKQYSLIGKELLLAMKKYYPGG